VTVQNKDVTYAPPAVTEIGALSTHTLKEVYDSIQGTLNGGKS
jgi:hypothetical protein